MRSLALACSLLIACSSASTPEPSAETPLEAAVPSSAVIDSSRIVSLGGDTTEVVAALGAGDRIVAADASSTYPPSIADRATLGVYRRLSAEGVLAAAPSVVLASPGTGPETAVAQIAQAGIAVVQVPPADSVQSALDRIRFLGRTLGEEARADALVAEAQAEMDAVAAAVSGRPRPRVLFVYARGGGTMMVAGQGTPIADLVAAAGGQLATPDHAGFAPLTSEAVVGQAPDVILLTSGGLEAMGGVDGVLAAPGVAATPAGRARRVVAVDDLLLLGFGPRVGQAARALAEALHPDVVAADR